MFKYKKRFATTIFKSNNVGTMLKQIETISGFFTKLHKLRSLRRSFLHFHFISAVHIWFISYIINTHFFHGNIWTHNSPAPNVSGFIAQLVEHRTGIREVTGSNPVEALNYFFQASLRKYINCVHCDDHFFIFIISLNLYKDATRLCFSENRCCKSSRVTSPSNFYIWQTNLAKWVIFSRFQL